ncbi:MAG: SDR family NAD(P)-dependent oxidoreductase, partial [Clostridia bacterium]|nr:SDR family NAD(P)-dependent oxidoreductase [Clostridia bacterium]
MKKVCVITGAGGVLCSAFAREMAKNGMAVALLDLNVEAAGKVADEINAAGGTAKAYAANVLDKSVLEEVHAKVLADLGPCSVLINGAGGNNPRATTAHETYEPGDETRDDIATFFNLDKSGFEFVFNLNIMGTLLPTQVFVKDMIGREGCSILN